MSLTSYRTAPPRTKLEILGELAIVSDETRPALVASPVPARESVPRYGAFQKPGGDLLSHALRRSTIGAGGFNGRVRNGIGWRPPARSHQAVEARRTDPTYDGPATKAARHDRLPMGTCVRAQRHMRCDVVLQRGLGPRHKSPANLPEGGSEEDQAYRAIRTVSFTRYRASTPAYQRGGLPRLSRETWFRGGLPA